MSESGYDVVIVGGGHNGLTAAAYLALAGKSVLLLERERQVGGAAVSADAFPGVDAQLSRYSYLVSLLPRRIIDELGLDVRFARRRYSSYTPHPDKPETGLLVDHGDTAATRASFNRVAPADFPAWTAFYTDTAVLARALFPTVCEPLLTRSEARRLVADDTLWNAFIERPLGEVITARFESDLVRGIVATDGLIGTFASLDDPGLHANRCFLYHVIGNETGDWDVPIGGMGAVSGALAKAAAQAGARLETEAEVTGITPAGEVRFRQGGQDHTVTGAFVLSNVAPWVLGGLLLEPQESLVRPVGAQVKVNLLLSRLPRLREPDISPEAAFGGTFHINETYGQLERAFTAALQDPAPGESGGLIPCEVYCHSLTDPSILSPELRNAGVHTLTVFGLHTPHRDRGERANAELRDHLQAAVLRSLNSVLAEPVEDLLVVDAAGHPCIETKTTRDLEIALNLPGGNIFHGPLAWPFIEDDAPRSTPAERWGVQTPHPRILLCGAGARRGGGVSGIGGHNAAMAVLES
ncbi:phytoene desaturase family protein [Cryobacterium psychrophilum]|uniref:NAD(P)/FAD-dependent oxidoreductase n=1 Tax=Cryobacterium psychrophilum TaxID=41988 RepID=A0A4Y8KL05_9MICO|nr:NAD(P)/FAD-dependent oxidoreductase [Cryobacterium psychrophilum]TDW30297.1 phytoene dehydrogenase-like protein [Cryobacterium psychrophilum]TFD77512.1 NAD(P)/FAD-dependent oxidoreductase [Cryobacterium psychrophilum]